LVPQSLVLSIFAFNDAMFSVHDPSVTLVGPDGSVSCTLTITDTDTCLLQFFTSIALYNCIATHVGQFALLTELFFHNAHLLPLIHDLIKSFPLLESLASMTDSSQPSPRTSQPLMFSHRPPITSLALWNVRNEMDHPAASLRSALHLAMIPSIHVFHVDWTPESAVYLNITHAAVQQTPSRSSQSCLIDPLIMFLNSVPTINHLFVTNHLPFCLLHPDTLPHLSPFSSPHT
jgi:hypothetical protein